MQIPGARVVHNVPFFKSLARPVQAGPVELVVIQATPFCNLDCSYCYLPDRDDSNKISEGTVALAVQRLAESGLLGETVSFVWHAGEPMVAGIAFYERVFDLIEQELGRDIRVRHCFQTNGVLINRRWCAFFNKWQVSVGVSIDGPGFIHDRHRKSRNGKGTHRAVMAGIHSLANAGIGFHTISVLTDFSLDYPDEMFHFFHDNRILHCGFNIEEQERVNTRSSLSGDRTVERFRRYYRRFHALNRQAGFPLKVREFDNAIQAIKNWDRAHPDRCTHSQELVPMRIVSIDVKGNYSSYSPELLGENTVEYGPFIFGNVVTHSLLEAAQSARFRQVNADIQRGVQRCRQECRYFQVCGGGSPSNKYYENGTFNSSQTLFCTLQRQVLIDLMLDEIEAGSAFLQPGTCA